jgi:uncharacterized protein (DUF362 family)
MPSPLSRRSFLKSTLATGSLLFAGPGLGRAFAEGYPPSVGEPLPELAAVTGDNAYDAAVKAVGLLGGMSRFVPRGSRAGLLINSRFRNVGTYVKPQIALAAVVMLHEAGVKEIVSLEEVESSYWRRASLSDEHRDIVRSVVGPRGKTTVSLTNARNVKEMEIVKDYLDCDVVINVAIFKDHAGTQFTGALKNIMGATAGDTNQSWHLGGGGKGYYDNVAYLSQCIADGNLCRLPTLCIGDATEVITQRGPFGPGPTKDFRTVVAGTNPVSFDAFGSTILGFKQDEIRMVRSAAELGIGSCSLESIAIARASL